MKHLRLFQSNAEYTAYAEGDMVLPNVSYVKESSKVHFKPYIPPPISLCDIAYWDGSKVKTVSQDKWDTSLGTPVGVVVIPSGFAPDGKARMISLKYATSAGTSSNSLVSMPWGVMVQTPVSQTTQGYLPQTMLEVQALVQQVMVIYHQISLLVQHHLWTLPRSIHRLLT